MKSVESRGSRVEGQHVEVFIVDDSEDVTVARDEDFDRFWGAEKVGL